MGKTLGQPTMAVAATKPGALAPDKTDIIRPAGGKVSEFELTAWARKLGTETSRLTEAVDIGRHKIWVGIFVRAKNCKEF